MRKGMTKARSMSDGTSDGSLPRLPKLDLQILRSAPQSGDENRTDAFLKVRSYELALLRDGVASKPFTYDVVDRKALDACVIVAHHVRDGAVHVWLRSSVRPPVALRPGASASSSSEGNAPASPLDGVLWEVPAGLIEPGEAPLDAAVRELDEELGFRVEPRELRPLGDWTLPAPGFIGEMHHFFHVRVDEAAQRIPEGDGSPLESDALLVAVPLDRALAACRRGEIRDAKTELALRRLADEKQTRP